MNSPIDELLKLIRFLGRCDLEREVNLVWIGQWIGESVMRICVSGIAQEHNLFAAVGNRDQVIDGITFAVSIKRTELLTTAST
jgi:hypothetical protein